MIAVTHCNTWTINGHVPKGPCNPRHAFCTQLQWPFNRYRGLIEHVFLAWHRDISWYHMISPAFTHWMHKIAQVRHHFTGWTSARSPAERSRQPTRGFWVEQFPIQVSFKSIKVNPSSSNWIQANPSSSNSIQASKEFGLVSQLLTYKTWQVPVGNCSDLDPLEMVYPPQMAITNGEDVTNPL